MERWTNVQAVEVEEIRLTSFTDSHKNSLLVSVVSAVTAKGNALVMLSHTLWTVTVVKLSLQLVNVRSQNI